MKNCFFDELISKLWLIINNSVKCTGNYVVIPRGFSPISLGHYATVFFQKFLRNWGIIRVTRVIPLSNYSNRTQIPRDFARGFTVFKTYFNNWIFIPYFIILVKSIYIKLDSVTWKNQIKDLKQYFLIRKEMLYTT